MEEYLYYSSGPIATSSGDQRDRAGLGARVKLAGELWLTGVFPGSEPVGANIAGGVGELAN
jgi:hypothetical protein